MSRDYAKKQSTRTKASRKKRPAKTVRHKGHLFYALLIGLVGIGAYRYFAVDFSKIKKDVMQTVDVAHKKAKEIKQPVFEFYTRLPNGQEQVYHSPATPKQSKKGRAQIQLSAHSSPSPQANHQYLIQVGSFKKFSDADKLRAALILLGYEVRLSRFINNTVTWHRVEVGPYLSLQQTKEQQQLLENQHYNGLIKQVG